MAAREGTAPPPPMPLRQASTKPGRKTHVLDGGSSTGHLPQSGREQRQDCGGLTRRCCPGTSRAQPSTHMSLSASVPVADGRETHVAGLTSMEAHGAQGPHQDIPFATNKSTLSNSSCFTVHESLSPRNNIGTEKVTFAFAFPVGQDPKGYRHEAVSEKDAHMQSYLRTVQVFLFRMDLRSHTSPLCAQLGIETSTKWQPPGCLATRLPG
ncbi:hypothetical protein GW17_00003748 [Ensete ventricosum]|nr:hypothetical protein GW17_00003748 [Ensete ventricosum]RZR86415.1 hypothetical protein BHM03_00013612 [Ensete ventricosum]